jgi:glycosyltransferase involved in cell wall biosynthesis
VVGPGVGAALDSAQFPGNFHFHHQAFGVMNSRKLPKVQQKMSSIEAQVRPHCVVTTSGPPYWRSEAPHLVGFNLPLYIYPESPYLKTLSLGARARLSARKWLHRRLFRRDADALIVQTDDVNLRVRRLLKTEKVYTVTNNHSSWYDLPQDFPSRLPERKPGAFRLLTLTSYYPHKNLDLIPQVIEELPDALRTRVEFVLTLTEAEYRHKISSRIPPQVRLVGPVPPPECPALYHECDAMFLPTLAECFSASYPEAMKMEKPIITTGLDFARSICQEAALYFPPCDANAAARQVERVICDANVQDKLRLSGRERLAAFDTPAQRAQKILGICNQLAAGTGQLRPAGSRV